MTRLIIPGTQGFTIDRAGNVYDSFGNLKNNYVNGDGYITVGIKTNSGKRVTFGLHRLLAITYIPNDRKDRIEVNHKNGDKKLFDISNLEWVTPSENNIHSELLREDLVRVKVLIYKHGTPCAVAKNLSEAEEKTLIPKLEVWNCIKDKLTTLDGFSFEYLFQSKKPPGIFKSIREIKISEGVSKSIKVRDTETGEVTYFKSLSEAGRFFNTSSGAIHQAIQKTDITRMLHRRYQVAYTEENFYLFSELELLKARNRGSKEIFAINVKTFEEIVMNSASDFIKKFQLSKKSVTTALASDLIRRNGSWLFTYNTEDKVKKLKAFVASPVAT